MSTYLITGVASEQSIAWAVAERLLRGGDKCILASLPGNVRRAQRLMRHFDAEQSVVPLDVSSDESLAELGQEVEKRTKSLDGVLHSIAHAPLDELREEVLMVSREGFRSTFETSTYSLMAILRAVLPRLGHHASVVALTYRGSQQVMDGYGIMGPAKAALECFVRYLATELGPRGIRINSVSPGPILTLSASVFPDIEARIEAAARRSPMRQRTTHAQVAEVVGFLLGAGAAGVTGQCVGVDQGLSVLGT